MGRHSSPSPWAFYRSLVAWMLPWIFVAVAVATGIWFSVNALGNDDIDPSSSTAQAPDPTRSPTPQAAETTPPRRASPTAEPEPSPSPTAALITEGITVQVLNATADESADDRMADELADLGFEVISVVGAAVPYEETTVFWSGDEWVDAAQALASRYGWETGLKPDNLSPTVSLHVVVGDDYL